jgi:undecaprenyl-diphosphatase
VKGFEPFGQAADADLILAAIALLLLAIGIAGRWMARHPATVQALIERARQHQQAVRLRSLLDSLPRRSQPGLALGLSITAGLLILALSVWIFGSLLQDVLAQEETALLDAPILSFIASHRVAWVTRAMELVTFAGDEVFLVILTIAVGLLLRYRTHSWRPLLLLATSVLGATLLESVAKEVIGRPRPPSAWMAAPSG